MKESEPSSWLAMRLGGNRSEGKQAVNGDGKRARSPLFPVNLETRWTSDLESKLKRPAMSEPPANKRSYEQIRVSTEEGKRVLPSDIRLHLDKLRRTASQQAAAMESKRLEMARLEEEREQLQKQIAMKKEIKRLQEELQQEDDIAGCHLELHKPALSTTQSRQSPIGHRLGNRVNEWEEHGGESLVSRRDRVDKEKVYSEEDDDSDWRNTVKRLQKDINLCKKFVSSQTKSKVHVESPLSEEIESTIIDRRLKIPSMDQFDGSTDPHDFLNVFDGRMSFYGHSEIARCRFFYTCLQGTALKWFNNLPSRSISSWSSLKEKFCLRFSSNLRGGKITASLMKVRQDHNESLRNFLVRFRAEVAEIPNLVEELAINYLAAGVDKSRHGSMLEEFFDKNPRTLQAGFQILEHRLTLQEAVGSMHSTMATKNDYKKQDDSVKPQGQAARTWQRSRSDNDYTKLNTDRSSILAVLKTEPDYRPPRPLNPDRPPSNFYCDYHEDTGHTTDRRYQLKDYIESKIRQGQLIHYVSQEKPLTLDRVIDVIFGGDASGGQSNNGRKAYARMVGNIASGSNKRPHTAISQTISFSDEDYPPGFIADHQDALVITAKVVCNSVRKILIDSGSAVDVLYKSTLDRMDLGERKMVGREVTPLYGFSGNEVRVVGTIDLPVLFGSLPCQRWEVVHFHVVEAPACYNAILGRPSLSTIRAVASIHHLKMKFPTEFGIGEVVGDQVESRKCYLQAVTRAQRPEVNNVVELDPRQFENTKEQVISAPKEEIEDVELVVGRPDRTTKIGKELPSELKQALIEMLRQYVDIFAWNAQDMPGLPAEIAQHCLSIKDHFKPVCQKKRNFSEEKQVAIDQEVTKLLEANFIVEVNYPEWVSNVVMVKKSNGKWRMCVDYTDLNKACPKDFYPLPNIDQMIDATAGHQWLSFMDAFSGYNQIRMNPEDIPSTAFITHRGVFAYIVMPFGLINAGATFQRAMDKIFRAQIGRNMLVYVDDIIVKTKYEGNHLLDLEESFKRIREVGMRLNPAKCTFGVSSGRFLGFIVTQRGIEIDPKQIKAISMMKAPSSPKEVQVLTGMIAALRRFISTSSARSLPFIQALKAFGASTKNNNIDAQFVWTTECQLNFEKLKQYLAAPPIMSQPEEGEILYLYLSATASTLAAALIKMVGDEQRPVYFISHTLRDAETRYSNIEKMIYSLIVASRKLRHYFQGREIVVYTSLPFNRLLHRPDMTGRLAAWTVELAQFNISYKSRTAIKAQVLADFVAECQFGNEDGDGITQSKEQWKLFVDGASATDISGLGICLISPDGFKIRQSIKVRFDVTNNEAEYEALIAGLKLARSLQVSRLYVLSDSQLVVKQFTGEFKVVNDRMVRYLAMVKDFLSSFDEFSLVNISRKDNEEADMLSKLLQEATGGAKFPVYFDEIHRPSIEEPIVVMDIEIEEDWRTSIMAYIQHDELPQDKNEAKKLRERAASYCVVDGKLYKRSYMGPLLKCVSPREALVALDEVHEGVCGEHQGSKALCLKIMRQGFFWPTMRAQCEDYVKKCKACQMYARVSHRPAHDLTSITSPIPFYMWGIDIVGPFPTAKAQMKFLVVAVDYSTKWIEARPTARIAEKDMIKFFMEQIVFRFGIPRVVLTDNGSQFIGQKFEGVMDELGIKHVKASVAYPQANGQVEVSNRILLQGIKKRLLQGNRNWVDELPNVLWAYRTTPRTTTGETPFRLVYGTEALLPIEINLGSRRVEAFEPTQSEIGLQLDKDLLEETREIVAIRNAQYQQRTAQYYNRKVKPRQFQVGDLVLREASASDPTHCSKLSAPWEGPYRVIARVRPGAYHLSTMDGVEVKNTWNTFHLKKYYP